MLIIMFNKLLESSGLQQLILGIFEVFKSNAGWGVGWLMVLSQIGYLIVTKSL